jgi:hypothetical protein
MKRFAGRMYEIIIRMKKSNKKGIKLCSENCFITEVPSSLFKCADLLILMVNKLCLLEEKLNLCLLEGRCPLSESDKYAKESKQR